MAENRRIADLHLGQPGLLTYISSHGPDRPGILHSTRITSHAPRFNIVGTTANLYAPSRPACPDPSSNPRDTIKAQGRWLSNSHPEAFIGGAPALSGMLKDSLNRSGHSENLHDGRETLVMGEMTDLRSRYPTVSPMIAVVTGESGQKLRVVAARRTQWQWGDHQDALLHLSVLDTSQQENETVWIGDGLPIVNVKFVTTWFLSRRARLLLVQTQTSVTLLQPEIHPIPVPDHAKPGPDTFQPPSYIAPNQLITLRHRETGGNDISDVWFVPAPVGSLPRIGVIDQCGYWSIWTLSGAWQVGMNTLRLSLYKCGHIHEGVLPSIPPLSAYPAQRHGMLQLARTRPDDASDRAVKLEQDGEEAEKSTKNHVLIWNAQKIVLLDLETEKFLPQLDIVRQSRLAPDWIIGVEPSPANDSHVFVLTARQIIWLDMALAQGTAKAVLRPTLLLACSHVGFGNEEYRISTCPASEDDLNSTMVFIFSPKVSQLTVYWFSVAPETQLPQYHRHITSLSSEENESAIDHAQLIKVCPAKLEAPWRSDEPGPGSEYVRHNVKFYQMTILGEDLSVRYCICTSLADAAIPVTLPTLRVSRPRSREHKHFKRRWRKLLKRLGGTFVVPDGMTDEHMVTLLNGRRGATRNNDEKPYQEAVVEHTPRPKLLNMDRIGREIASRLLSAINRGACGLPKGMMPFVRSTISQGMLESEQADDEGGRMELFFNVEEPVRYSEPNDGMEPDVEELLRSTGDNIVVTQLRRRAVDEAPGSILRYPSVLNQFSDFWLKPVATSLPQEMHHARHVWVCEAARDFFLSSYGFAVQDVPLFETGTSHDAQDDHADDISEPPSQRTQPGPKIAASSPAGLLSSSAGAGDDVFQRLRLLAPTLEPGTLGSLNPPKVLSYWPTKRGVDIGGYVSSIAVAEEARFSHIKARRRRVESKMKAQAEKYKIPPFRRQGFPVSDNLREDDVVADFARRPPPAQIMSSQVAVPDSSQSFGVAGPSVTMSQPVSGAFGDRKKVKKSKRKSGFR
ncbi:hypothetical protein E4U42_004811 [Claviceps africana]|uniref:RNA polymerase I-specific transcription initiation factor RRN6-like protein n=1 Tax=Claviceps africana TaxID=83212 RepID=A0A8K0J595_9HYPO|nr:hypothetical protein E4U42_004811 [Claviceps africana]